jgi:HSP20 family protein
MTLVKWNPNRVLYNWNENLFNDLFNNRMFFNEGLYPQVDIEERENEYVLNMELPGMNKGDISISFQEGVLNISGEKKDVRNGENVNHHLSERRYGRFERAFRIHSDVDASRIAASFKDGVLQIELPKAESAKPKQIDIKVK